MDAWAFVRTEMLRDAMLEELRGLVQRAPSHDSRQSAQASLNHVRTSWNRYFSAQSSEGGDSVIATMGDDMSHLRNMNVTLRRRLRRHNAVALELYQVLAGAPPVQHVAAVDSIMEDVLAKARDMQAGMRESQVASPEEQFTTSKAPAPSGNSEPAACCLADYWKLAEFKLRHAAQAVAMRLDELTPAGSRASDLAQLKLAHALREHEQERKRFAAQLEAEKEAHDAKVKQLMTDMEMLRLDHENHLAHLSAERAQEINKLNASHADELTLANHDFEMQLHQALQTARDDASLTTEQMHAERASAIERMREQLAQERRRHERTVQRLTDGGVAEDRTPQGKRRVQRKSSTSSRLAPYDVHNSVNVYVEDGVQWEGETTETLSALLKEKVAELQMQQATFGVQSKARTLEWETLLRETVARYEGELQTAHALLDREQFRTRETSKRLDEANHKISTLRYELKNEQSVAAERIEELERQAKIDIAEAKADALLCRTALNERQRMLDVAEGRLAEELAHAEQRDKEASRALQLVRQHLDTRDRPALDKSVQVDLMTNNLMHLEHAGRGRRGVSPTTNDSRHDSHHASRPPSTTPMNSRRGSFNSSRDGFAISQSMGSKTGLETLPHTARAKPKPPAKSKHRTAHRESPGAEGAEAISITEPTRAFSASPADEHDGSRSTPDRGSDVDAAHDASPEARQPASTGRRRKHRGEDEQRAAPTLSAGVKAKPAGEDVSKASPRVVLPSPGPQSRAGINANAVKTPAPPSAAPKLTTMLGANNTTSNSDALGGSRSLPASPRLTVLIEAPTPLGTSLNTSVREAALRPSPADSKPLDANKEARGLNMQHSAHALLSNDAIREAILSMPTMSDTATVEDKVNAATSLPPAVFGVIPTNIPEKRFFDTLHRMAVLCDFALPAASMVRGTTFEARLMDAVPLLRDRVAPAVQAVAPMDVVGVATHLAHSFVPAPLPPQNEQLPGEAKQRAAVIAATARVNEFVASQGYPADLAAVSWRDLERWRFHDRAGGEVVAPLVVREFLLLTIDALLNVRRYAIFRDKHIAKRRASAIKTPEAPTGISGIFGARRTTMVPLYVSTVESEELPPDTMAQRLSRPVRHLVDAVAIATESAKDHVRTSRMAHKRWASHRAEEASAAAAASALPLVMGTQMVPPLPGSPLQH
jgi:hypothetical protein